MSQVSATYTLEAYLGGVWTSIKARQIGQITASWGISGNGPIDFLAGTGTMQFTLRNADGLYSPANAAIVSSDWKKGCKVRIVFSYDGASRAWYGAIDDFSFESDPLHNTALVTVYVVDWMDKAAKYPLDYPDVQVEQRADQIVQTILTAMPIDPLEQDLATGSNTFSVAFDTLGDFTKATTEFTKILNSELCYMYVRHGGALGEKLVLENANTRAVATPKTIPILGTDAGFLLMETGDHLLLETGDKIILNLAQSFTGSNDFISSDTSFGDNVINSILFRYIPRVYEFYVNSINTVYGSPMFLQTQTSWYLNLSLNPGETKVLRTGYGFFHTGEEVLPSYHLYFKDLGQAVGEVSAPYPTTFGIAGMATTSLNTAAGYVDISADLSSSLVCKYDYLEITMTNHNAAIGYVVFYVYVSPGSAKIKKYPEVPVTVEDAASILANDTQPLQFDQPYQIDATDGTAFANAVLAVEANPRTVLNKINYCANRSSYYMQAFMSLDIGDLIPASDTNKGVGGGYFIQNMSWALDPGGIIWYSLGVKQNPNFGFSNVASSSVSPATSLAWSHVVASGDNRLLVVEVACRGSETVSSITYGAQSLAKMTGGSASTGSGSGDARVEIWFVVAPTVGTATVTVTMSASSQFEAASLSFYNVNQSTPLGTFASGAGTGTAATATATAAGGDIVIDVISTFAAVTIGSGQTSRWAANADANWHGAGSTKLGAASVAMAWTVASSQKWAVGVVAVKTA